MSRKQETYDAIGLYYNQLTTEQQDIAHHMAHHFYGFTPEEVETAFQGEASPELIDRFGGASMLDEVVQIYHNKRTMNDYPVLNDTLHERLYPHGGMVYDNYTPETMDPYRSLNEEQALAMTRLEQNLGPRPTSLDQDGPVLTI